jgi:hypothetical protein
MEMLEHPSPAYTYVRRDAASRPAEGSAGPRSPVTQQSILDGPAYRPQNLLSPPLAHEAHLHLHLAAADELESTQNSNNRLPEDPSGLHRQNGLCSRSEEDVPMVPRREGVA